MSIHKVMAVFESYDAALAARLSLPGIGIAEAFVRIPTNNVVIAELEQREQALAASEVFRDHGASEVTYTVSDDVPNWMGHFSERVTNQKVSPGEGDAEAGTTSSPRLDTRPRH
jgi:hypothetical protein